MRESIRCATSWPVVRRSLSYAVVVGALLAGINHGDAILRGDLDAARLARIGLTILVPYVVSTLASVGTLRQVTSEGRGGSEKPRS